MAKLTYETRKEITAQALQELTFARNHKQGKISSWQKNEAMYYGKKTKTDDSRANVELARMQEFVHTLMSKIDNPLVFKFSKTKNSQLKRVKRLNALRNRDQNEDDWDIKDIAGKKQAIIYGRAIYSYYADSENGYAPHLENVDVYDFLVDPNGGGLSLENARNMGRYGVLKTKEELKKGVKDKKYLKTETEELIRGANGNLEAFTEEETNKQSRKFDNNVYTAEQSLSDTGVYKFWEWYTTYNGERYYLLLNEDGGNSIRVEKLSDIFESNLWPFWTWACFPDLTEFWTPSFCDYVREIFMAQAVSINQALDNSEQINKPQKIVNVNRIENMASLKYRRDGVITVKGDFDADKAVQFVRVPQIDTPLKVFQVLETIQEKSSGVTSGAKGLSDEDKVGIYEGNEANAADRFGYLNKAYSFGYKCFARLYVAGVREHLRRKTAIEILGPDGVEQEEITNRDIFWKGDRFNIIVEASNAETALSETVKRTQIAFLGQNSANPVQSPKKAYEIGAGIAGFEDETIRQLMDTTEFGDADLMSEADRDIEMMLEGKTIKPNQAATTAYKQRFVDYMRDNEENIDEQDFAIFINYIEQLEPIIMRNMARKVSEQAMGQAVAQQPTNSVGGDVAPLPTVDITQGINNNNLL